MTQIGGGTAIPIVHTVELLDWSRGGPAPPGWSVPDAAVTTDFAATKPPSLLAQALADAAA